MSERVAEAALYKQYTPQADGRTERWGCMDDRPMVFPEPLEGLGLESEQLYLQMPGGGTGFGKIRAIAAEVRKEGGFSEIWNGTVTTYTRQLAGYASEDNIELLRHGSTNQDICGYEAHGNEIDSLILNEEDLVFNAARNIYRHLTRPRYRRTAQALGQLRQAGHIEDFAAMDQGLAGGRAATRMPKLPLLQQPHIADVLSINEGDYALDSRQAWAQGAPQYHISLGRAAQLNDRANTFAPELGTVNDHEFRSVLAIQAAATQLTLGRLTGKDIQTQVVHY